MTGEVYGHRKGEIMFIKKSEFEELKKDIELFKKHIHNNKPYVSCAKCGCLILEEDAYKAPGVIKQEIFFGEEVDYIHYDYYCKVHIPKRGKK